METIIFSYSEAGDERDDNKTVDNVSTVDNDVSTVTDGSTGDNTESDEENEPGDTYKVQYQNVKYVLRTPHYVSNDLLCFII